MALPRIGLTLLGSLGVSLLVMGTSGVHEGRLSTTAMQGKQVWENQACINCHALYGKGGHLGPDLTNAYGRRGEAYIRWIVESGRNQMPDYELTKSETDRLLSYLRFLHQSGTYPLPGLWQTPFGQHPSAQNPRSQGRQP